MFGSKRNGIIKGWRKIHNENHHNFYSSSSIIRMIKSRRMRWTEHVSLIGRRIHTVF
jgi:hypothetical protein